MTETIRTTAQVKENNKKLIRETLISLKQATKIMVARETGLSVATCNTLLNELARSEEIVEVKPEKKSSGAGRPSKTYRINEEFQLFSTLSIQEDHGKAVLLCRIFDCMGNVLLEKELVERNLTYATIQQLLQSAFTEYKSIKLISIGIDASLDSESTIQNSSLSALNGINLIQNIQEDFDLPALMDTRINLITQGFYHALEDPTLKNVIVLSFSDSKCTHAGLILQGQPYRGKQNAACDLSLINAPCEVVQKGLFRTPSKMNSLEVIARIISTFIQLLNPDIIMLTGSGITVSMIGTLSNACMHHVPEEHMPEMTYIQNPSEYYHIGLMESAMQQA